MDNSFTPIAYEYREIIQEAIDRHTSGKVFFWSEDLKVDEAIGELVCQEEIPNSGVFIVFNTGQRVRVDRIITLFGKPGAAYEEYDSYANQCLACTAGVPL